MRDANRPGSACSMSISDGIERLLSVKNRGCNTNGTACIAIRPDCSRRPSPSLEEANMKYAHSIVQGLLALLVFLTAASNLPARRVSAQSADATPATSELPVETGYAPVNGLRMYYEIHGDGGVPLVILHGASGTVDMF